jgi:hypothetical protein
LSKEHLHFDSNGNGWDAAGRLVDPWFEDEAETVRFTQKTAFAALTEEDREELEEWMHEQGLELPGLFERLPVRVSLVTSCDRLAA